MHVQCIVDEEYYAIEKPVIKVAQKAIEARENLADLVSQDEEGLEGSVLHTLRQRYE